MKFTDDDLEQVIRAYKAHGNSKSKAAQGLGISESAFRRRYDAAVNKENYRQFVAKTIQSRPQRHLVIPDCQVKPGVPTDHLEWIGNYIVDKKPDTVICIGDFFDMPSLSSYDKGKRSAENQRYQFDIEAGNDALERLMTPLVKANFYPRKIQTHGNHEHRIVRLGDDQPALYGKCTLEDMHFDKWGFEVYPFLDVVNVDGIEYSHYFTSGTMGRPVSSAAALLRERQGSATMGHVQNFDLAVHKKTQRMGLFCGCCYLHDEHYLGPQGNNYKRGIIVKNEVKDGVYDLMMVSLDFLRRKYS